MSNMKIERKEFLAKGIKGLAAITLMAAIPFKIFGKEKKKISVNINKDAVKRK